MKTLICMFLILAGSFCFAVKGICPNCGYFTKEYGEKTVSTRSINLLFQEDVVNSKENCRYCGTVTSYEFAENKTWSPVGILLIMTVLILLSFALSSFMFYCNIHHNRGLI